MRHGAQGGVGGHCAVLRPWPVRMRGGGAVGGVTTRVSGSGEGGGRSQGVIMVN